MILILEFFFYLFLISIWLYSLFDRNFLYTNQGGKIDKYIKEYDLKNITNSFDKTKRNNFFIWIKSPKSSKKVMYVIFATVVIMALKMAFTYKFLFSQIYIINFFGKNINLANILSDKYPCFKLFYYIFSFFVYLVLGIKILYKSSIKNSKKESIKLSKNIFVIGENNGELVGIGKNGLYQNILITGSIGSGKTSTAITNILNYFIRNNMKGLVLDVKGNFKDTVQQVINFNNSDVNINLISLENGYYNPIDIPKISAYELAGRIKKALIILSEKSTSDSYWLDKAESYIKDFIVLIRMYNDFVSFEEIHKLCINTDYLNSKIEKIKDKILTGKISEDILFELDNSISNLKNEYMKLDVRTQSIIRSEITRMTGVFVTDYNVCKRFCSKNHEKTNFLNGITVLSMNIGENPKLARVLATYIKLNFQNEVLSGLNKSDKFMICDEYQEFCNEEDGHFFSLSREYKCINVVAMQSYSSLKNTLKDENASKVIIQNFVNKIWFRNDDIYTIEEIVKHIGMEEKKKANISISENSQESKYNIFTKKFINNKSGITESFTINENLQNIIDTNYFTTKLKTFEAVCMISDGINVNPYKKVTMNMWKEGKTYENKLQNY